MPVSSLAVSIFSALQDHYDCANRVQVPIGAPELIVILLIHGIRISEIVPRGPLSWEQGEMSPHAQLRYRLPTLTHMQDHLRRTIDTSHTRNPTTLRNGVPPAHLSTNPRLHRSFPRSHNIHFILKISILPPSTTFLNALNAKSESRSEA
jgi:hypothetical protein